MRNELAARFMIDGTYKLAQGASDFTGSITIGTENEAFGAVSVNGDDFVYNNRHL